MNNLYSVCFWYYNPITIAIASRGNAESLMSFLVLMFILLLKKKWFISSGAFYGLSVHFKIYPVTFGLALLLYLLDLKKGPLSIKCSFKFIDFVKSRFNLIEFGLGFIFSFSAFTFFFYYK
jgi:GPI mannosyltransferase 1 subunit M